MYKKKKQKQKEKGGVVGGRKTQKRKWASTKKWPQRIYESVGWKPRVQRDAMKNSNRVAGRMVWHGRS